MFRYIKHKVLKNTKGSTLILVMFLGTLVVLFTPILMTLMDTNTRSHYSEKHTNESYYFARGGAEIALNFLGVKENNINEDLFSENHVIYLYGNEFDDLKVDYEGIFERKSERMVVRIESVNDEILINSMSYKNDKKIEVNALIKVNKEEQDELDLLDFLEFTFFAGASTIDIHNAIELDGSSSITGKIGTNTSEENTVSLGWSTSINGDLHIIRDVNYYDIISSTNSINNIISGSIKNFEKEKKYPNIKTIEAPDNLQNKGSLTTTWIPSGKHTISKDGFFQSINVIANRILEIDLNNENRVLVVKNFNISQGEVRILNKGNDGSLDIYVLDDFTLGGSSKFNVGNDNNNINVFYLGSNDIDFNGNQVFNGNLYMQSSNFTLGGSTSFYGHILSNGENIIVKGNASALNHMIYAPNSRVAVLGSGLIKNVVIADKVELTGNSHILFDEDIGFTNIKETFLFDLLSINDNNNKDGDINIFWY